MKPLVSVIVPSYNQGEYIKETLNSIFSQSYSYIEVFVVDGGSIDNTVEILKEYSDSLFSIVNPPFYISESDKGYADALNKGFKKIIGDIIIIQNSDDCFEGEAIKEAVEFFEKYPDIGLIYGNNYHVNERSELIRLNFKRQCTYEDVITSDFVLPLTSTFFRRSALDLIGGGVDEDINHGTDYSIWLKMACKGVKMMYVNRFFSSFRIHGESMNIGNTKGDEDKRKSVRRLVKDPNYKVKKWRLALSGIYYREGSKRRDMGMPVLKCFIMMIFYRPSLFLHPKQLFKRGRRMGLI